MINMINHQLEVYQSYCRLQTKYKQVYEELEQKYHCCPCFSCKLELILFGLELLTLNSLVEHLESQIVPGIDTILNEMKVDFILSDTGRVELTAKQHR